MRTGILSDDFIRSTNPAFFPDRTPRKRAPRTRVIKRPVIPYYDLYATARLTMDNPFDGARELILNYVPGEAVAAAAAAPAAVPAAAPAAQSDAAPSADGAPGPSTAGQSDPNSPNAYTAQLRAHQNAMDAASPDLSVGSPGYTPPPRGGAGPRTAPHFYERTRMAQQQSSIVASRLRPFANATRSAVNTMLSPLSRAPQFADAPAAQAPLPFGDLQ